MQKKYILLALSLIFLDHCYAAEQSNILSPGIIKPADQEEGWTILPEGRPFPLTIPDPRELRTSLRKNNKKEIEADVGAYKSVVGWKGDVKGASTVIHAGIEGDGYFLMRKDQSKFPLYSSDGLIALYTEAARGSLTYQLRYTHISAHLSDGLFAVRDRITYTRETLSLRLAQQFELLRVYAGYHYLAHTLPELPRHSFQVGFYSIFSVGWKHFFPFFGGDLKIRGAEEGMLYSVSTGLALLSTMKSAPLRFTLNYLKGHDPRGQFYKEKTEKWTLGIDLDF